MCWAKVKEADCGRTHLVKGPVRAQGTQQGCSQTVGQELTHTQQVQQLQDSRSLTKRASHTCFSTLPLLLLSPGPWLSLDVSTATTFMTASRSPGSKAFAWALRAHALTLERSNCPDDEVRRG
jgi:hypothetical protein